ncbi:MAG: M1 family peptidase [Gemmatimonadetes bacterium]|nr:M1 family peptidase [Gemmatimonadota bacterium]
MTRRAGAILLVVAALAQPAGAQIGPTRPLPEPVRGPLAYRGAVERGTRSADGAHGPRYWTNHSRYDIQGELDPFTGRITGSETIVYQNNSPDTLAQLALHLHLDIHREGTIRNEPEEITGGVTLLRFTIDGAAITEGSLGQPGRWSRSATVLRARPPRPVPPGGSATLAIDWEEVLPQNSSGRIGYSGREIYFVGYWYPRMAVYDDLRSWDAQPYLGNAEFYDDFGDYRVALSVPAGWTVMGTGALTNPQEVWSEQTRRRVAAAAAADTVVHVATRGDRNAKTVTAAAPSGRLTWRFAADTVRDFAWTTSSTQLWDATSARVADRDRNGREDRVLIHSFWRETRAPLWAEMAKYGKDGIEHHSRFTGLAYPWPHMTIVEGEDIVGGGMEFPMLTLISAYSSAKSLHSTTVHEIAHMWVPMIVGANEKRYAWIDEGSSTFLENQDRAAFWPGDAADAGDRESYLGTAAAERELPLMTHGDYYETLEGYLVASYSKPALLFSALRDVLGAETFDRAYREFVAEWAFKLPSPWDLFATFERAAGRDLDWFWRAFYYETWVVDRAVGRVEARASGPVVVVEDHGYAQLPARVRIQTTRGGTMERIIPVEAWLTGDITAEIQLPASVGAITRVEIDADLPFPDVRPGDNVWSAPTR